MIFIDEAGDGTGVFGPIFKVNAVVDDFGMAETVLLVELLE